MYKSICSSIGVMPGVIFIHCVLHSLSQIYGMESPINTAHHKYVVWALHVNTIKLGSLMLDQQVLLIL